MITTLMKALVEADVKDQKLYRRAILKYWGELIGVTHAEVFLTTEPFAIPDLVQALG
jgi:hypothetical protein